MGLCPSCVPPSAACGCSRKGSRHRTGENRQPLSWNLTLTIKYAQEEGHRINDGVVAVDLGWAQETLKDADGRIRVAGVRVKNVQGETFEEFCLPAEYQKTLEYLDGLK